MGHAYFLSAQYNESANVFLKIQEPDLSDVPLELPLSLAKTGRHEQAAIYFEKTWLNDVNYPGIVLDRDISKDDVPHLLLYLCSLEKSKLWERARQVRAALRFLDPTLIVEPALPLKFVQGWSRLKLKEKIFAHERYSFDTGKVYSYQDIAPAVQKIMGVTGWWWDDQMLKEYQSMDARVLETFGVDNEEIQKMLSDYQIQIDAYFEQNNLNL
jgi:tetratricopeptide (TPR) repeat protein